MLSELPFIPYRRYSYLYKICADFCCFLFLNRPPKFDVVYSEAAFGHSRTDVTQSNLAELLARFALSLDLPFTPVLIHDL
jgi:hypothetical protein